MVMRISIFDNGAYAPLGGTRADAG